MVVKSESSPLARPRGRWRNMPTHWRVTLGALVLWPLLAWGAARALVIRVGPQRADALVVLSGSAAYVERTDSAARLFKEGRAPLVLLTNDGNLGGWSVTEERNPPFVDLAVGRLRSGGVPPDKILVLSQRPTNTYDEAAAVRDYAVEHRLGTLLVVTSAYHSRRALWTWQRVFRGTGIEVGLEPASRGVRTPPAWSWWLSGDGWRQVAGEYVKMVFYAAKY
jgi:uncharacterized SAM-binding protein YcdF (DUF218 family)